MKVFICAAGKRGGLQKACSTCCSALMITGGEFVPIELTENLRLLSFYLQVEHGFPKNQQRPCCSCCFTLMTTGGAWFPTDLTEIMPL